VIAQHFEYNALLIFGRYGFLEPEEIENNSWAVIQNDATWQNY
jgi:hypothetical protein